MVKKIFLISFFVIAILLVPKITKAVSKNSSLAGDWVFKPIGKKANHGMPMKNLTRSFTLKFLKGKQKKKEVTGAPFGYKIDESKIRIYGTKFKLTTTHIMTGGHREYIKFEGTLSKDGKTITNGKFKMTMGSGIFTAKKIKK